MIFQTSHPLLKYLDIINDPTLEAIDKYIDDIYLLRQESLKEKNEFGLGNLTFKEIRIASKINELKPDIIVFTGDLLDKNISLTQNTEEELTTYLSSLKCSLYKYAIYGDEDLDNKRYSEIMSNSGFILLENKITPLYYKDTTPIIITGYNPIITKPNYTILTDFIDTEYQLGLTVFILSNTLFKL